MLKKMTRENIRYSRLIASVMSLLTAAGILSGAVGVPILCRQFYYMHITPLQIRLRCGLTEEQIRETYNEVMDYCLGVTDNFELTHLIWSAEGASHFADVRGLFIFDLAVFTICVALLAALWGICRTKKIKPHLFKGHTPGFWAATALLSFFLIVGGLAAVNFDVFFTAFHTVFFPGKDNWIFDFRTDPVIRMLPQVFFQNCALLVLALVVVCCVVLLVADWKFRKNHCLFCSKRA